MKHTKLIIETINHLLETQDAVFISCEKNQRSDILILLRDKTWGWKYVIFEKESQYEGFCADVGLLVIKFSKYVTKTFALLVWASYSTIEYLDGILTDLSDPEQGITYEGIKQGNFKSIALGKTVQIEEPIDEKTLLHLLDYLSIEY